jgi:hypothetical protein
MKTSFSHQMGQKNFVGLPYGRPGLPAEAKASRRREKGPKKIPSLRIEDWGFTRLHPSQSYPRRPLREEYPGRFSDSPDLNSPSHPELVEGQWLFC